MAAFHMDDFHAFDRDERQSLHSWLVAEGLSTGLLISYRTVILPRLLLLESYKVAPDGGRVYQHYRPVTRHRLHWARSRPPRVGCTACYRRQSVDAILDWLWLYLPLGWWHHDVRETPRGCRVHEAAAEDRKSA